jgi:type 1 glutamine amidotransferase
MKRLLAAFGICLLVSSISLRALAADAASSDAARIRVLVVTGGHDFEKAPFFKLFSDNEAISFKAVEHPNFHALLKPDAAKAYDVLVLYDMYQPITEEAKADFVRLLKDGKGLVVLHHAIASYQNWPEYNRIIGARYYLEKTTVNGVEKARSIYQHDVQIKVKVANKDHPVTKGLNDFVIHDETYKLFDVADECQALLTTEEPLSNPVIAWAKTYEMARVVYMQSGHDHFAYENPNYRKLVAQAIAWTAKR